MNLRDDQKTALLVVAGVSVAALVILALITAFSELRYGA